MSEVSTADLEHALVADALNRHEHFQTYGLSDADFESRDAKLIVSAATHAWESGEGSGLDVVARVLQRRGELEKLGGTRGLALMSLAPHGVVSDAKKLKEQRRLTRMRDMALEVARLAGEGDFAGASAALHDAQQVALETSAGKTLNAGDLGRAVFESIRDASKARRINTGLPLLRKHIGDLPVGSMTVVAADSNVGKSWFVLALLLAAAKHTRVGFVSLEDPDDTIGGRLIAAMTGVSSRSIQRLDLQPEDLRAMARGVEDLNKLGDSFMAEDCIGGSDVDVCAAMSRMAAKGAKLVVVDYLQEIECSKKLQDRRNEMRWISKRIKTHARRLGMALIFVSQLARPTDKQTGKEPTKHMIKESGDVVAQAEVILLLWRDEEHDLSPVSVKAAKVKWGGVGAEWKMRRTKEGGGMLSEIPGSDKHEQR